MPSPKFAVLNEAGEQITSLPAGLGDGENIFEAAIRARQQATVESAPDHTQDEIATEPTTEELSSVDDEPETVEQQPPPEKPKGPYPADMPLFSFQFPTQITVELPLKVGQPDPVWLWELYDKPFHILTWQWMKHAEVPRGIQRLIVSHMRNYPAEYEECFTKWFKMLNGGATPGE